jgi:LDH2 family malate/lactate/ureidoglycolate dehydrogenase
MGEETKAGRTSVRAVRGFIADALQTRGLPPADADKVAELMVGADLIGADAHGIFRLPQYVQRLKLGAVNPTPRIAVNKTAAATALVDGDNGMGHLVVAMAMETAIEMARDAGVAWVGIKNSNHAGAAGVYAAMPLAHGMIGFYSAVASANHMGVWGGADMTLGTNPLAIAVPAGEEPPVVLDIATSTVSYGTVKNYRLQKKEMPEGWMVSVKDGKPLTDPARSNEGVLLPMGGYKGAGLALMLGLLGGPLNGAAFGRDTVDFNNEPEKIANTGQFVIALDIKRFVPPEQFKSEVDRHMRELKASKLLPGFDEIRLPGEQRQKRLDDRSAHGITLPAELVTVLEKLAAELGITPLNARG